MGDYSFYRSASNQHFCFDRSRDFGCRIIESGSFLAYQRAVFFDIHSKVAMGSSLLAVRCERLRPTKEHYHRIPNKNLATLRDLCPRRFLHARDPILLKLAVPSLELWTVAIPACGLDQPILGYARYGERRRRMELCSAFSKPHSYSRGGRSPLRFVLLIENLERPDSLVVLASKL